jgi:glycosyltransferase involved in cell wall biosynthesis
MKILYLTGHLNTGGITSYLLTLVKGLKQEGHLVYVASSGGELLEDFQECGIIHLPIPLKTKSEVSPQVILSFFKLRDFIKAANIDLIHANTHVSQVLACLLSRFTGRPYLFTCHGFFRRRFSRRLFPCWGKKVIAISAQVKEHLLRDFKVDEEKIALIHNGIDVERFRRQKTEDRRQTRQALGLGSGQIVGIIARLSEVKGHLYLLEAMSRVLQQLPQAQLLIIGEGRIKTDLLRLSQRLKMGKSVFFIPSLKDTTAALAMMDVFVMPSLQEGLGLALMEAMACGCAVIGSDVGGIRALIRDGTNGLLVRPKDPEDLSRKLLFLLGDAQKRKSLGENAQQFIAQHFSQSKMVAETKGVYLECLYRK